MREGTTMRFLAVPLPEEISREEGLGNFSRAKAMVKERLKSNLPKLLKERLEYELERIERIINDYPFSEEEAKKKLFESVTGFSDEEYMGLYKGGYFDYRVIEDKKWFERRFLDNLIFSLPEYRKRVKEEEEMIKARECLHARLDDLISSNAPKTFRITAEIKVKPDMDKIDGEKLKCWLPFPKIGNPVLSARLLECSHKKYIISQNDSPQRTIYMEDMPQGHIEFSAMFEYVIREQTHHVNPDKIIQVNPKEFSHFLHQHPPHIIFTEYLKELASEIVGEEENPYLKAKRIYDWITLKVRYSYMHAYSTYETLSEFAASNLRGDCGVQALLFITLCRISGVPAGWQSGWVANPFGISSHDWAVFYVDPNGWLPADLSFGGARREMPRYREFYFANLDGFRMVANSDFMADFTPAKRYWRSDPTDNQVGEMETELGNVYYNSFQHESRIISFEEVEK